MTDVLAARISQPDLVDLPDWRVAAILNAPDPAFGLVTVPVPVADARQVLMSSLTPDLSTTAWVAILLVADDGANTARKAALAIREAIREATVINMTDPMEAGMVMATLSALINTTIITEETRDRLLALSQKEQSWAQANGITVTEDSIFTARGRPRFIGAEG